MRPADTEVLRALDRALQAFVCERDPQADPLLVAAVGLVSFQVGNGHACVDLDALPEVPGAGGIVAALRSTSHDALRRRLLASPLVAEATHVGEPTLFVLDGRRFYLRRQWDHERAIVAAISRRLQYGFDAPDGLAAALDALFPPCVDVDWQRVACALAAASRFAVITGGPGTGKTTTVVRMLALLQQRALAAQGTPLRIALAAPTGKAAARLGVSIAAQLDALSLAPAVRDAMPSQVGTVHRLLGRRHGSRRPRHDAHEPLPLDVLIVDEASMLDLELAAALFAALPQHARLILLGDKDQLASVEAGAVFGDLCRHAEHAAYLPATREWIAAATGCVVPAQVAGAGHALEQHIVMLRHSHRFGADSGIGRLAAACNRGDGDALAAILQREHDDLGWLAGDAIDASEAAVRLACEGYRGYLDAIAEARPQAHDAESAWLDWAAHVLARYGEFQLLTALREGSHGVSGLNARIAAALRRERRIEADGEWYEGRPVMITRNEAALGLMNGDVGITLAMPRGEGDARVLRVAFNGVEAARVRLVSPARLVAVDTVYAMTVHKSQGSEFAHTALMLPPADSPVLTRELLYTAITRARRRFTLIGPLDVASRAASTPTRRASGLAAAWRHSAAPLGEQLSLSL